MGKQLESASFSAESEAEIPMFYVPSGVTANFATVSEIRGIREKIAKGVGKTAFAGLFRPQRGLTKGYWHGELGSLEGKLHHFEITPVAGMPR